MPLVTDVSAILSAAFDDEGPEPGRSVLKAIVDGGGVVPALFWFEVRNAVLMGERRGRVTPSQVDRFLDRLDALPIEVEPPAAGPRTLELARTHHLTVYDAAYLELALRRGAPLATIDRELIKSAPNVGVTIFSPPAAA